MPTIVLRVSNAGAQGTRWRATPNAHRRKDQTVKISEKREETTSQRWLIFTAVNWLSFIALQTGSAWITSSSLTNAICAACSPRTSTTTTEPERIYHLARIAQTRARSGHRGSDESSPFRMSAAFIIATNASPLDSSQLLADRWLPCSRLRCHLGITVAEVVRPRFRADRFEVQIAARFTSAHQFDGNSRSCRNCGSKWNF